MCAYIDVIAIDGPTASGKGTVAGLIAQKLGFHYLDSGALYRLTALAAKKRNVAFEKHDAVASVARNLNVRFDAGRIWLDDEDVTDAIRVEEIGLAASVVAAILPVREALLDKQKSFRQSPGLVADGRDMASVVFPDARLKVFLTASASARAKRRYSQLIEKGFSANLADLTRDLEERDRRDRERATSPCLPAADAFVLDSSNLTIDQTVDQILVWWHEKIV